MSKESESGSETIKPKRWKQMPLEYRWLSSLFPREVLDPWFPLAIELNDARAWARNETPVLPWLWQADDHPRDRPFDRLMRNLGDLQLKEDPSTYNRITELDQRITQLKSSEGGDLRFKILLAYQAYEEQMGRLPRMEQLRYAVWAITCYSLAPSVAGRADAYLEKLPTVFKREGGPGFPPVMDKSQFARAVREMGLRLGRSGNSHPKEPVEWTVDHIGTRWSLDDFIDYLACSGGRSEARAWTQGRTPDIKGKRRDVAITYVFKTHGMSKRKSDRCCIMFHAIEKLDRLLNSFFASTSFLIEDTFVNPLRRGMKNAIRKFNAWPSFSQFLCGCDASDLQELASSRIFAGAEGQALLGLAQALNSNPAQKLGYIWAHAEALKGLVAAFGPTPPVPFQSRGIDTPTVKSVKPISRVDPPKYFRPTKNWSGLVASLREQNLELLRLRLTRDSALIRPEEMVSALELIDSTLKGPPIDLRSGGRGVPATAYQKRKRRT